MLPTFVSCDVRFYVVPDGSRSFPWARKGHIYIQQMANEATPIKIVPFLMPRSRCSRAAKDGEVRPIRKQPEHNSWELCSISKDTMNMKTIERVLRPLKTSSLFRLFRKSPILLVELYRV